MAPEIIAAIIGGVAVIIAAVISKVIMVKKDPAYVRFIRENEDFRNIMVQAKDICSYTVNSHEILNKINTILEQNQEVVIQNFTLLVRKKINESPKDIEHLNTNIDLWKDLERKGRIRNLTIIAYDHDPDHYYTLFGNRLVFCGQVLFDKNKPTGTTVDYRPLVFENTDQIGAQVIKNYQTHFDNIVEKYRATATIYSSSHRKD